MSTHTAPRRTVLSREPSERARIAEAIAEWMDGPITALGIIVALLVLAETVARPSGAVGVALDVAGWVIWALFVAEFVLRAVIAPSTADFLRRNWWQLIFLAVPFFRFVRILARLRVTRLGRVVSSAVRTGRTAGAKLTTRLGWMSAVTAIVILSASQVLYEFGRIATYGQALHATALGAITGEPLPFEGGVARALEVALALYSAVVFAALAGMIGAYFLEGRRTTHGP